MDANDRLIVALDVFSAPEAQKIVQSIGEAARTFKVGKQLFVSEGPAIVRELVAAGRQVFLDLKFHDIPNTVGLAVKAAAELKVAMLTVHASGGSKMLRAAVEAARSAAAKPQVLAVTVLTSMSDQDVEEVGFSGTARDQVLRLAALARNVGCNGVVASPRECAEVRRELGEGFAIVTPGIRPAGSQKGDQERTATPAEAIRAGASHIVVGRPITVAADPKAAARAIIEEIAHGTAVATR
jgi:orotidine-5'-phosphate decarboxylase